MFAKIVPVAQMTSITPVATSPEPKMSVAKVKKSKTKPVKTLASKWSRRSRKQTVRYGFYPDVKVTRKAVKVDSRLIES